MKLHADRLPDRLYTVYHAEKCLVLKNVVWIDDEVNQYYAYDDPPRVIGNDIAGSVHDARKIVIYPDRLLVIINPLEDDEDAPVRVDETVELTA